VFGNGPALQALGNIVERISWGFTPGCHITGLQPSRGREPQITRKQHSCSCILRISRFKNFFGEDLGIWGLVVPLLCGTNFDGLAVSAANGTSAVHAVVFAKRTDSKMYKAFKWKRLM
jgi:hypothetical protein